MNSATKTGVLPSLTADFLEQSNLSIDNTFNSAWKHLGFNSLLLQAKFHKRSGVPASRYCVSTYAVGLAKNSIGSDVLSRCIIEL